MALIVSGAPFTAPISSPEGKAETVDIRLRADEKWNRRRMINLMPWGASFFRGVTKSPMEVGDQVGRNRGQVCLFTIANGPLHGIQGCLLHRITNDSAVVELDECMGSSQCQDGLPSHLLDVN